MLCTVAFAVKHGLREELCYTVGIALYYGCCMMCTVAFGYARTERCARYYPHKSSPPIRVVRTGLALFVVIILLIAQTAHFVGARSGGGREGQ